MSENNLCECKFCIWVRNFVFIFGIKRLMHFVAFLLFSIIIQIVFENNNASALEQITKNLPLKKPFLVVQNPDYEEVCNKAGNFLGVENVEQGDANLDFLTFSFDTRYKNEYTSQDYRPPYGAFECCSALTMEGYLFADVDNDGKNEVVSRSSGSIVSSRTILHQLVVTGSWISKDDADYEEVMNYLFELLKRAMAFNNNLEEHGIYNNLVYVESFFEKEYRQVEAAKVSPQVAEKIKKIIKQFQNILEQNKQNFGQNDTNLLSTFLFRPLYQKDLFFAKDITVQQTPYINEEELSGSDYYYAIKASPGKPLSGGGVLEFFKYKEKNYMFYNDFLILKPCEMKRYYEKNNLPANDMTYIKLSWQPEFYTPNNHKEAMYFKVAKGGEKDFQIVCLFELRESAPDKIFDIY